MTESFELAQINVAVFRKPKDDPANLDFINALDQVNAAAERADGFIWRLQDESGNSTNFNPSGNPDLIVNISVWHDIESLRNFAYRQADHVAIMQRRGAWFIAEESGVALWWVKAGERPDPAAALARLRFLKAKGPSAKAFTFKEQFAPPDGISSEGLIPS